jgi:hypothetical protein
MPVSSELADLQAEAATPAMNSQAGGDIPFGGRRWRWILVVAPLALLALVAALWIVWSRGGMRNNRPEPGGPLPATIAEPTAPPPALEFGLAALDDSDSHPAGEVAGERMEAAATKAEQWLAALPADGRAPPQSIVVPGGQRAATQKEIPRHERWEIAFPPGNTSESYTRQLDYFRIELGLVGSSDEITYLTNLSDPSPTKRTAPAAEETRLYLVWSRGAIREADEQLAARAKIATSGKTFVHFCPPQIETEMARLEDAEAKKHGRKHVRRTVFGIRPNGFGGYQFYVVEQQGDAA